TFSPEVQQAWNICEGVAAAEHTAAEYFFEAAEQRDRADGDALVEGRGTDRNRHAAGANTGDTGFNELCDAGCLESIIHADIVREFATFFLDFSFQRIDHMGGAHLQRHVPAFFHGIGSENHGGTGNACALYGREAHTTQAHDEHGGTCFYFSRVENSADTGLQGAASEAGQLEGNILVDF